MALRVVPRGRRFRVAAALAAGLRPLLRRTTAAREQRARRMDGDREIALGAVMEHLTRHGTEFDPVLDIDDGSLRDALREGRGVLLIATHGRLADVMARLLHDAGHTPYVVSQTPTFPIQGTRRMIVTLQTDSSLMFRVRTALRGGGVVCAKIDHRRGGDSLIAFPTALGEVWISDGLIRLAVRCGARVIFAAPRAGARGAIVGAVAAPSPSSLGSPEAITREFISFVQAHVLAVARA